MLSISAPRTASGAASYYLHMEKDSMGRVGEYYVKEGEPGYWLGQGAERLGLAGQVSPEDFKSLCDGYDQHGNALAINAGDENRRAGWDLTFSAPKSVSVAWSVADERTRQAIEQAHGKAVAEAFGVMQEKAGYVRTGPQGQQLERAQLVAAAFQHGSSRELDAQLHTHVFLMNSGIRESGLSASLASELLFDYKMAGGATYQCALADQLQQLGYQLERDGPDSFRIASVPRDLEEAHSTRRAQIEAELEHSGLSSAKASAAATLKTRKAKAEPSATELRQAWGKLAKEFNYSAEKARPTNQPIKEFSNAQTQDRPHIERQPVDRALSKSHATGPQTFGRAESLGQRQPANVLRTLQGRGLDVERERGNPGLLPRDARHNVEQVRAEQLNQLRQPAAVSSQVKDQPSTRHVLLAATEHDAIITDAHITREAYRLCICKTGTADASQLAKMARREAVRVVKVKGERDVSRRYALARYTTRDLMKAERDILRTSIARQSEARHMVDAKTIGAALKRTAQAKGYALNTEQAAAVQKLAGSAGGVQIMVGDAGTGKSSTLYAVREAHEAAGLRVLGTSTGGKASAELMASSGIDSRNLAKLRSDLEKGREQLDARTVVVIDEAGMTSSRDLAAIMNAADEAGAKVILVGDWKQLQPVGAGETFRALDKELGSARLENINRQSNDWERQAVKDLSRGEAAQALKAYDERGRIHIDATYEKAMKDVATRHVANMREVGADKAVALAGTNQAVDRINAEVRAQLHKDGQLQGGEKFQTLDSNRNSGQREIELAKGDRVMIATTDSAKGYTNGDAGRVVDMDAKDGSISVKLDRTGETVQVKTQEAEVRHGYAMTTHKAQGSTYDRATVYLDSNSSREMAYVQASRAKEETHFVATSHTVKEMRQDTPAPEALQKAVEATAAAREAAGKDRGLEPDTKANMQAAIDYIKANKDYAPPEAKREAKNAQTMHGLSEAMSRSRPKETTLDYAERPSPERGQAKEDRFKEQLGKLEKVMSAERAKDPHQDTSRERGERGERTYKGEEGGRER